MTPIPITQAVEPSRWFEDFWAEVEEKEQVQKIELDKLKADQLLMAISKLEMQMSDVNDLCDSEIKLIESYRSAELERLEKKVNWLLFSLEGFARQQMAESGEKTMRLPHGSLALRKGRDKVEIADMDAFLKVAPRYGLLRTIEEKHEPDLSAVSAYIKRTGQVPIGTRLIPAGVNFTYSITKGNGNNGNEQR